MGVAAASVWSAGCRPGSTRPEYASGCPRTGRRPVRATSPVSRCAGTERRRSSAETAAFPLSPAASCPTGVMLPVDCGARHGFWADAARSCPRRAHRVAQLTPSARRLTPRAGAPRAVRAGAGRMTSGPGRHRVLLGLVGVGARRGRRVRARRRAVRPVGDVLHDSVGDGGPSPGGRGATATPGVRSSKWNCVVARRGCGRLERWRWTDGRKRYGSRPSSAACSRWRPRDGAWITERAAAPVLRRAADFTGGARPGRPRISPVDPGASHDPVVPPPPSAVPPGPLRIDPDFPASADPTAPAAEPLWATAARPRASPATAATERLGLTVTEVDPRVMGSLDADDASAAAPDDGCPAEEPAPGPPARRRGVPPGRRRAVRSGRDPPDRSPGRPGPRGQHRNRQRSSGG